ncbi:hypothetical protein NA56DRAFT_134102 [Hyaloscypha hepaticicola]|uniref:Uncharacterized protein n=1 Tax=Hyaloscypha hepaticicola TaxID=2082293 RepID=A0A2J6Q4G6_9HELO|nr:hypothetical protein NA56DRAFT_134102 [Hyaloscypha hepaticicola]
MALDEEIEAPSPSEGGEKYRWGELIQEIHHLSRLQEEASYAQIAARQKRREASFKRQDVWLRDAEFMRRVQELNAQGRFEGFDDLARLASKCQTARDVLGPVEQEGIEAEQKWEGQLWELQRAEERIYRDYEDEFGDAATYSQGLQTDIFTKKEHSTALEEHDSIYPKTSSLTPEQPLATSTASLTTSQAMLHKVDANARLNEKEPKNAILLDLVESAENAVALSSVETPLEWDSDSGIVDISLIPTVNTHEDLAYSFQKLPDKQFASLDPYPHLLTDFGSTRDRVNKWLEHTVLVSRVEGISLYTILKDQLETENALLPTNWAQLVVAYWYLDGASIPKVRQRRKGRETAQSENENKGNTKLE